MAGFYINPYTALIGKAGQSVPPINGVQTGVICDDFEATITTATPPWQANQLTLGSLLTYDSSHVTGSTTVKFDQSSASQQASDYVAGAWLANQIFVQQSASNTTAQGEYTYALWELFDPGAAIAWLQANNNDGGAAAAQAQIFLNNGKGFAASFGGNYSTLDASYQNEFIYTPTQAGIQELDAFSGIAVGNAVPTPEPSAPALLAVYLSSLMGLILLFRRRVVGTAN